MTENNSSTNVSAVLERVGVSLGTNKDTDIAKALGVSRQTVSGWRRRDSVPYESLIPFAKENNLALDYLFWGNGSEKGESKTTLDVSENQVSESLQPWVDAIQMSDLLHFIFNELNDALFLEEQIPGEEPFRFISHVYCQLIYNLPKGLSLNSEEAYELAKRLCKDEIRYYEQLVEIASKNTAAKTNKADNIPSGNEPKASQNFHGSVGQVGGGDINNDFGNKGK
ncbi:helix-turn-helix domain-containing protein [Neptuniibacter marinus]|uniref:helix-turn-helix domain-containing protein n=1 Tax=Neptuniibacter marinus TaxID=1806670 RepID=UPI0008331853|nr:helix-turn-helix domain-containing protein [Neptuniibacter marinus]